MMSLALGIYSFAIAATIKPNKFNTKKLVVQVSKKLIKQKNKKETWAILVSGCPGQDPFMWCCFQSEFAATLWMVCHDVCTGADQPCGD